MLIATLSKQCANTLQGKYQSDSTNRIHGMGIISLHPTEILHVKHHSTREAVVRLPGAMHRPSPLNRIAWQNIFGNFSNSRPDIRYAQRSEAGWILAGGLDK